VTLKFWGVRGSIPTPGPSTLRYGGNTPCVEVRCGDALLILDAGSGIRELGNALMAQGRPITAHLMISHSHWDHVQGFPFFIPAYVRGNSIHVYGCLGADRSLREVLEGQMEFTYFPVALDELGSAVAFHEVDEGQFQVAGVPVRAMYANHPGLCLNYRLEWEGKTAVYMCDSEPYDRLANPEDTAPAEEYVGIVEGIDPRLAEFARGADLLIADCPYTAEEYRQRRGWGHGSVEDVVQIAVDAEVKRLALFHHDPSHPDDKIDEMVEHARSLLTAARASTECFGAREQLVVTL